MSATVPSLVIRGGTVVDGTGAPPYTADIAISGETITAVGKDLDLRGSREVDASGLLVTPGWVDAHTHYDGQLFWDPYCSPSTANGVTTVAMGNCGVGFAPCSKPLQGWLIDLMDSIEDIPAASLKAGFDFEWETFPEYLACLQQRRFACDVGVLIGHAPVRGWVRGTRASLSDRPGGPTDNPLTIDEIECVAKVVEEAVAAGALGFSGSRQLAHRDKDGVLMPGSLASVEEMLAIGRGIVRGGGGLYQMANDFSSYDDIPHEKADQKRAIQHYKDEWGWITELATEAGGQLTISTNIATGMTPESATHHRSMLKQYERIAEKGGNIVGQVMMRMGGLHFSIASGTHPFVASSTFTQIWTEAASAQDLTERMRDREVREAIIAETRAAATAASPHPFLGILAAAEWIWPWSVDYEQRSEDCLKMRAKREGKRLLECAYDILARPDLPHGGILWRALYNYGTKDMEPIREMISHKQVVSGFADGGAHLKIVCDATTPTTLLTHWARDRSRGPQLPLEMLVRKQSWETAQLLGLSDRGELRVGMKADVNLIDFSALKVLTPRFVTDLPLHAGRWTQAVEGYRMTIVSGEIVFENGEATGALPGRLVRNPRSIGLHDLRGSVMADNGLGNATSDVDLTAHALELAQRTAHAGPSAVGRILKSQQSRL